MRIAVLLLGAVLCGCGQDENAATPPSLRPTSATKPDLAAYRDQRFAQRELAQFLYARNFDELDARLGILQEGYESGQTSGAELLWAYRAFYIPTPEVRPALDEWLVRSPKSYAAHVGRALHFKYLARTQLSASKGSAEGVANAKASMTAAMADLTKSRSLARRPVLTFVHMIDIGMYRGDSEFNRRTLNEAVAALGPEIVVLRKYLYSLRLGRSGDVAEMTRFVDGWRAKGLASEHLSTLSAVIRLEEGSLLQSNKKFEQALTAYQEAARTAADPDERVQAMWGVANMNRALERWQASIEMLDQIEPLTPEDRAVFANRGYAHHRLDRPAKAAVDYRTAAELGDVFSQNTLGDLLWHGVGVAKDHKEALKWFRRAAAAGFPDARRNIEAALREDPSLR